MKKEIEFKVDDLVSFNLNGVVKLGYVIRANPNRCLVSLTPHNEQWIRSTSLTLESRLTPLTR